MLSISRSSFFGIAAAVALPISVSGQSVHVVPSGADVQAVIDSAAPGDTLLFRAGPLVVGVVDKPLRLLADTSPSIFSVELTVQGVQSGEVVIQGFDQLLAITVTVENCTAPVWLEDLGMSGSGTGRVTVRNSDRVFLGNSTLRGVFDVLGGSTEPAVEVTNSTLTIHGCSINGAQVVPIFAVAPGGDALAVSGSTVVLQDCTVQGGDGVDGPMALNDIDGGDGLVADGGSVVRARATTFAGGAPGVDQTTGMVGQPGVPASIAPGGVFVESMGPAHRVAVPALIREGESFDYRLSGPVGDLLFLTFTFTPTYLFSPAFDGTLLTGRPDSVVPLGPVPPTGEIVVSSTPQRLLLGVDSATFFVQVFGADPATGEALVGNGTTITLLDSAF